MNVKITARKFKAHSTLKDFINSEIDSLNKFNDNILDIDVILSFQNSSNSVKTVEMILKVPGQIMTATESSDDFKKSAASVVQKLSKQLQKLKTKRSARVKA